MLIGRNLLNWLRNFASGRGADRDPSKSPTLPFLSIYYDICALGLQGCAYSQPWRSVQAQDRPQHSRPPQPGCRGSCHKLAAEDGGPTVCVASLPALLLLVLVGTAHGGNAVADADQDGAPAIAVRRSAVSLPEGDIHSFEFEEPAGFGPPTPASKHLRSRAPTIGTGRMPAPGGGTGQVWVNMPSKAYYFPDRRYYEMTRRNEYMTEAAKAAGAHPAGGRFCS